jgi:hypothetical protein
MRAASGLGFRIVPGGRGVDRAADDQIVVVGFSLPRALRVVVTGTQMISVDILDR